MKAILMDIWEDLLLSMSFIFRWIGNSFRRHTPTVLTFGKNLFSQLFGWVKNDVIPYLWQERRWVLLALAVLSTLLSIANGAEWRTVIIWILLTIAAIINALNKWGEALKFLAGNGWMLLSGLLGLMVGKKGRGLAMFSNGSVLFIFGFWMGGNNGPVFAGIGTLLIIGSVLYTVDKKASQMMKK